MHYVTEDELRAAYAAGPFASYRVPADARLTPSARQFLIDFHVDFGPEAAPAASGRAQGAGVPAQARCAAPYAAFCDDAHVMGARLRLAACRCLGIRNDLAAALDEAGRAWQALGEPGGDAADAASCEVSLAGAEADGGCAPLVPELSARTHPLYFELALVASELDRVRHAWEGARQEMAPAERAAACAWDAHARELRALLGEAVGAAGEEVRHG